MKVGIVGCGLVGSTAAYAMVMAGIGREIVLVDRDRKRSSREADDISHSSSTDYDGGSNGAGRQGPGAWRF